MKVGQMGRITSSNLLDSPFNAAQSVVGFLGCKHTLLPHAVHPPAPPMSFSTALYTLVTQLLFMFAIANLCANYLILANL